MPTIKPCEWCGKPFEARRSTARFCSKRCRQAANRRGRAIVPDSPLPPMPPASFEDVVEAVSDARKVSNTFAQLAHRAPRKLQPGCGRIGEAIARAIDDEEW